MKVAIVYKDKTGYWTAKCKDKNERIIGLEKTECEAIKAVNSLGYVAV